MELNEKKGKEYPEVLPKCPGASVTLQIKDLTKDVLQNVVRSLLYNFGTITAAWAGRVEKFKGLSEHYTNLISMSRDQLSPGKSLSTFYYALCRLNRSQISLEVGSFLERSITHSNQLDLSFCPGILGSCNLLDHQALSVALSLNSTLETLVIRDMEYKKATDLVSNILRSWGSTLGKALESNTAKKLEVLYFYQSGKFKDIDLFASSLSKYQQLTSLVLSNMSLTSKGITQILTSLQAMRELRILDLSNNKMDSQSTEILAMWLGKLNTPKLERINLSNTGAIVNTLAASLNDLNDLTWLALNGNKIDENNSKKFLDFLAKSKLKNLYISSCSLTPQLVKDTLSSLSQNALLEFLDISELSLTDSEALANLKQLNVQGLKLSNMEVNQKVSLTSLNLDNALLENPQDLASLVKRLPNLHKLSLRAINQRTNLLPLFTTLSSKSQSLSHLDITGQLCGDDAWFELCQSLHHNTTLRVLAARNNGLGYNAYLATLNTMYSNTTCSQIDILDSMFYLQVEANPVLSVFFLEISSRLPKKYDIQPSDFFTGTLRFCYTPNVQSLFPQRPNTVPPGVRSPQRQTVTAHSPALSPSSSLSPLMSPAEVKSKGKDDNEDSLQGDSKKKNSRLWQRRSLAISKDKIVSDKKKAKTKAADNTSTPQSPEPIVIDTTQVETPVEEPEPESEIKTSESVVLFSTKYQVSCKMNKQWIDSKPTESPPSPPVGVSPYQAGAAWSKKESTIMKLPLSLIEGSDSHEGKPAFRLSANRQPSEASQSTEHSPSRHRANAELILPRPNISPTLSLAQDHSTDST